MTHIIRAARTGDLQALYEMAKSAGGGFTNLPPDRKALTAKLERAAEAFGRHDDKIADDLFVFVLENTVTGDVRGTCQIFSQVGQKWPLAADPSQAAVATVREAGLAQQAATASSPKS